MTGLEITAGEALEWTLEHYARLRLDPTATQAKRARSVVMEAASRERLDAPSDLASRDAAPFTAHTPTRPVPLARRPPFGARARRVVVSFAAAALAGLMLGTSAFAASRAGGPLYDVRLGLEVLARPADPTARLDAELEFAHARLAEIVEGVSSDDSGAVAAAVRAYMASLDGVETTTARPADRALSAVQGHRTILLALLTRVPEDARSGMENALVRSSAVISRLSAAAGHPATIGGGAPTRGDSTGSGVGGATKHAAGKPADPGARPSRDPKPSRTAAPAGNERPAPMPARGGRSPQGGGGGRR